MEATEEAAPAMAMKPWEQHHAVISMPRFAYNPASILQNKPGFLVTCTFRREKSATKEILALIQEVDAHDSLYINLEEDGSRNAETGETGTQLADVEQALPKTGAAPSFQGVPAISCPAEESRMPFQGSTCEDGASISCVGEEDQAVSGPGPANSSHKDIMKTGETEFTLVKLATMGVIYICASCKPPNTVLTIASRIVKDVQAGKRAAPQWCHRIVPVQATCSTKREELQAVVSQLVKDHLREHVSSCEQQLTNVVAFNRRGDFAARSCSTDSLETTVLGRDECIKSVVSAVEQVTTTVKVDLNSPQMVVSVELIPVAGSQTYLMCAVSVLPGDIIVTKPKINVKALAPLNPKSKKRKHSR